jgi:hypothetical protein
LQDRVRIGAMVAREHVRMSSHKLFRDAARDIFECKLSTFMGDLRMENDLQQKIAEFLLQVCVIAGLDRRDNLVSFLDQTGSQRAVRLLTVPWTSAGSPQQCDDFPQCIERSNRRIGRRERL